MKGDLYHTMQSVRLSHLEDGEVLEDAVLHVGLGEALELGDEVDHVLAHGAGLDLVDVAAVLVARVLRLQLLDDLLAEAADLGGALDGHLLAALVGGGDAVEGVLRAGRVGRAGVVEVRPELDEEEGLGRALLVQLLQTALLLGELVLDLAHVDRLQRNGN